MKNSKYKSRKSRKRALASRRVFQKSVAMQSDLVINRSLRRSFRDRFKSLRARLGLR